MTLTLLVACTSPFSEAPADESVTIPSVLAHPSAWKGNSENFAFERFSEVRVEPGRVRSYLYGGKGQSC